MLVFLEICPQLIKFNMHYKAVQSIPNHKKAGFVIKNNWVASISQTVCRALRTIISNYTTVYNI